jgi:hypothetical protein
MWEHLESMIVQISSDPEAQWSFVSDLFV